MLFFIQEKINIVLVLSRQGSPSSKLLAISGKRSEYQLEMKENWSRVIELGLVSVQKT